MGRYQSRVACIDLAKTKFYISHTNTKFPPSNTKFEVAPKNKEKFLLSRIATPFFFFSIITTMREGDWNSSSLNKKLYKNIKYE